MKFYKSRDATFTHVYFTINTRVSNWANSNRSEIQPW